MNGLLARSQNPGPFFSDGETRTQDLTDMRGRVRGWSSDPVGPCARVCSNVCRAHASRAAASQSGSSIFGDTKLPNFDVVVSRNTDRPIDRPRPIIPDQSPKMSAKYAFTKSLKEVRFLFCQTGEHSAATR